MKGNLSPADTAWIFVVIVVVIILAATVLIMRKRKNKRMGATGGNTDVMGGLDAAVGRILGAGAAAADADDDFDFDSFDVADSVVPVDSA